MAGIQTTAHHVRRGELFIAQDLYVAMGRTTSWTDEANPPVEDPDTLDIDEIVCYVPCDIKSFIVQDIAGLLLFDGLRWSTVSIEQAYAQQAIYVIVSGTFTQNDVPLVTYRQYGLYSGLVKASTAPTSGPLLPEHVTSNGVLEAYHNHPPVVRTNYMSEERRFFTKF